ncbi:MAG: hypothetical protein ACREIA_05155 [Opitutaceae bacterium]
MNIASNSSLWRRLLRSAGQRLFHTADNNDSESSCRFDEGTFDARSALHGLFDLMEMRGCRVVKIPTRVLELGRYARWMDHFTHAVYVGVNPARLAGSPHA